MQRQQQKTCPGRSVRQSAKVHFTVDAREQPVTVSIGLAVFPKDCRTADDLVANAHSALYRAKSDRRGRHFVFERSIRTELWTRARLEAELVRALERNEFELFYQPKVSLEDDTLVGVEALIRWRHPYRGLISPADFMHVAKNLTVFDPLALWVMRYCMQPGPHLAVRMASTFPWRSIFSRHCKSDPASLRRQSR